MKNYKKIGIMGGTFDPPHLGHLISAEYVAEALGLVSVVFITTGKKVYKESSAADAADRGLERRCELYIRDPRKIAQRKSECSF